MAIVSDRSRIETGQQCPRRRYWGYHYGGLGIELAAQVPPPWELLTGTFVHEGIEHVVKGLTPIEAATVAHLAYSNALLVILSTVEPGPVKDSLLDEVVEQGNLVIALTYGWSKIGLPRYLAEYEPLDIEHEEAITFTVGGEEVTFLARTDILGRSRASGKPIIHNLKTVSNPDMKWRQAWRYDQQTMTEVMATEHRLGEEIVGVVIEGLVKGKRQEYPEGSGKWQHNNMLTWCWTRDAEPPLTDAEYYSRYEWTCTEPHGEGRRQCPGGKRHRLSGVHKARVSEVYPGGITAWIDHLMLTDRETVERYFISLPPIMRSEYEYQRWRRQVLPKEVAYDGYAKEIERLAKTEPDTAATLLDYYFPMHTGHGNCLRPSECQFLGLCWGSDDPEDKNKWRARVANHPSEVGLVQIANG